MHPRSRVLCGSLLVGVLVALILAIPSSQPATAYQQQIPAGAARKFECRWADLPMVLDGSADERAWKHAQTIEQFTQPWLSDPQCTRLPTKAKLLWDREYLYFFVEMDDHSLFADITKHNGPTGTNDAVSFFIKPAANKPGYFEFHVNAAGAVFDRFHQQRGTKEKFAGEFRVEVVVKLRGTLNKREGQDRGWSVEGRIPWIDFLRAGGRPEPGEQWQFALCRYDFDKEGKEVELSTCTPLSSKPPLGFHGHEEYAALTFLGLDETTAAKPLGVAKRTAVTTSMVIGSPDPPPPYRIKRVYPRYSPLFPIMVKLIPGTDQLLVITQPSSYAPTALVRIMDDPSVTDADVVKLIDFDGVAYDFTFHPQFMNNGFVFVGWNSVDPVKKANFTRITRYTMKTMPPYTLDPKSSKTIIEWESKGHDGGAICFGLDRMLYVTSGDGTSDSDTNLMGQRTDSLLAKVLRIDVDHVDGDKPYVVPKDNPFIGDQRFRPETWAYGLRNPWRITCDTQTGHIWVGNNGQDQWEQAYLVRRGANYGWSVMEGSHPFYPNRTAGPTAISLPTLEHAHSEARSLTGGIVYHGQALPGLCGEYIYGDYSTGRIWAGRHDGTRLATHREIARTSLKITGFSINHRGELLICDHQGSGQGAFYTLEPMPKDEPQTPFPRKLSESGLFASVFGHRMVPGVVPYSVNAPFWSDGLLKERFIALPPGGRIGFTHSRGWNFPDRTVIIKSFAAEQEEGNPASKKWVETRFLTKQSGEWFGYSYLWREDQSDADLVGAAGMDRDISIKGRPSPEYPTGQRTQRWHIPSRAECMVCHTRAANFVLGLCELQMNKEHEYPGGVRDQQFRVFEHLGLLEYDWAEEAKGLLKERGRKSGLTGSAVDDYQRAHLPQPNQRQPRPSTQLHQSSEKFQTLANPYDPSQDLTLRARSWLHVNCSACHVEAGGGNAQMELEYNTALDKMRVLDTPPMHQTFGLPDARLIAPGNAARSILLHRSGLRGSGQMPPLSSNIVDIEGVKLLHAWINGLKK